MPETKQVIKSDQVGGRVGRGIFRHKEPRRHLWGGEVQGAISGKSWRQASRQREQTGRLELGMLGHRDKASIPEPSERRGRWPKLGADPKARPKHVSLTHMWKELDLIPRHWEAIRRFYTASGRTRIGIRSPHTQGSHEQAKPYPRSPMPLCPAPDP